MLLVDAVFHVFNGVFDVTNRPWLFTIYSKNPEISDGM